MKLLIKPEPGDFFYIPAVDEFNVDEFFITRYIEYIKPNLGHLIEVFKKFLRSFILNLPKKIRMLIQMKGCLDLYFVVCDFQVYHDGEYYLVIRIMISLIQAMRVFPLPLVVVFGLAEKLRI